MNFPLRVGEVIHARSTLHMLCTENFFERTQVLDYSAKACGALNYLTRSAYSLLCQFGLKRSQWTLRTCDANRKKLYRHSYHYVVLSTKREAHLMCKPLRTSQLRLGRHLNIYV